MNRFDAIKLNPASFRVYSSRLKLSKLGKDYQCLCPFHSEKSPSFQLFNKSGDWAWVCKSGANCGGGNVIQFIAKLNGIDDKKAAALIEEEIGSSWDGKSKKVDETFRNMESESKEQKKTFTLDQYQKLEDALADSREAQTWLLKERGIDYPTAKSLHFGFKQDLGNISSSKPELANKGWIVIPCVENGIVTSIEYRSIAEKAFFRQPGMGTSLFNTDGIDFLDTLYVTEGKFDAAVLEQAGYRAISLPNATTKLTPEMKDTLMLANQVILAGDNDSAGEAAMSKLWAELQERTFMLRWPSGVKDANDLFLKNCDRQTDKFRETVDRLTAEAQGNPMPNFTSIQQALENSTAGNLLDDPRRLRFPWPAVDKMAILLPGSVLTMFATQTGMGKTTLVMNANMYQAQKYGEVILSYQCELTPEEMATMVAAHVLKTDRNKISKEDRKRAAGLLKNIQYYVGRDSTLTTVGPTLDLIESAIRRLGATVVVLDHLHYICRNERDEVKAQADAMQRIKNMAVKYGVKMIVIGQPRKADKQNRGKVVHITDAKGSETLTSDADAVMAIHRDFVKNKNEDTENEYMPETEIHLLKARSKGDGRSFANLMCFGELATFASVVKGFDSGVTKSLYEPSKGI